MREARIREERVLIVANGSSIGSRICILSLLLCREALHQPVEGHQGHSARAILRLPHARVLVCLDVGDPRPEQLDLVHHSLSRHAVRCSLSLRYLFVLSLA